MSTTSPAANAVPKVSVFMMAYNHAPYIGQALDSALAQQTSFTVEIVVGEDCSTDDTRSIIMGYMQRYPGRIRALFHDINIGASLNQVLVLEACTGQYIAMLEGDDYWTDPCKLQKQVDFLDKNLDFALCVHNQAIVSANGSLTGKLVNSVQPFDTYTVEQLAKGNIIPSASSVYRNNMTAGPLSTGVPEWFKNVKLGDYCLHMLMARFGKIKYLPGVMGAYRVHEQGAWSLQGVAKRNIYLFDSLELLKTEFDGEVYHELSAQQLFNLSEIADHSNATPDFNLTEFFAVRQEAILRLIKDNYSSFIKIHFMQQVALRSAEYRYGAIAIRPLRWLVRKVRKN